AYEKGLFVLTAAQGDQAAREASAFGHGLLTYALIQEGLLEGEAYKGNPEGITVSNWFDYAVARVPVLQGLKMREAKTRGQELVLIDGEDALEVERRTRQRPRAFYRREADRPELIISRRYR